MSDIDNTIGQPDQDMLDDIAKNGITLVHDEIEGEGTTRAFTLGLWHARQQPEVVVLGLPEDVAYDLLNLLADDVEEGACLAAGSTREGILHGYPVYFGKVDARQAQALLPEVCRLYGRADVPVLQLVYPDKQGRWPWDENVREGFAAMQPVLERASSSEAR